MKINICIAHDELMLENQCKGMILMLLCLEI